MDSRVERQDAPHGVSVSLLCKHNKAQPVGKLKWMFTGAVTGGNGSERLIYYLVRGDHPKVFRNSVVFDGDAELGDASIALVNVTEEDTGLYSCIMELDETNGDKHVHCYWLAVMPP
ncbi:unnamed protein product, partial [Lampetra fluviatilis]